MDVCRPTAHPGDYARLILLEDQLPTGLIEDLVTWHEVGEQRRRGLTAAMAVRCVLMMVLLPNAGQREVMAAVAGHWRSCRGPDPGRCPAGRSCPGTGRSWAGPCSSTCSPSSPERWLPAWTNSGPGWSRRTGPRPGGWGICCCARATGSGPGWRTATTAKSSAHSVPATTSSPYPQIRAVVVTVCATRALLGAAAAACEVGEQTLTRQIVTDQPWVFAAGRCYLFDRNFLGATLVEEILKAEAHLLMRMKAGIDLPNQGWLPDGSHRSGCDCQAAGRSRSGSSTTTSSRPARSSPAGSCSPW